MATPPRTHTPWLLHPNQQYSPKMLFPVTLCLLPSPPPPLVALISVINLISPRWLVLLVPDLGGARLFLWDFLRGFILHLFGGFWGFCKCQ